MKHAPLILLCLAFVLFWFLDPSGSSLIPLMMLTSVVSGSIAVVAGARLSNARWTAPLEKPLLALAPLLILPAIYRHKIELYAWSKHPNAWLNPQFFNVRNAAIFLIAVILAFFFKRAIEKDSPNKKFLAAAYIFAFVAALSLVAFDWIMSFDYPWISTMFGPLFMVEAFYAGLALAGILGLGLKDVEPGTRAKTLHSTTTLMFGFSIFWGGLFFAQYLTIWYGNLPEEVGYFTRRFALPFGEPLFWLSLLLLFFIPFLILLTNPPRRHPAAVIAASTSIFSGIFIERCFYLLPHIHLSPIWMPLELLTVIGVVALAVRGSRASKA
jgi:Ni/Fe-hydrogenase subunit HybB-like protein